MSGDYNKVKAILSGVDKIYFTDRASAAVLDGSVVTWARKDFGCDCNKVKAALRGMDKIYVPR